MMVSDRAKALLQVASSSYLSVGSMPDLFHFMQDLGKSIGAPLARQKQQAAKKMEKNDRESIDYNLIMQDLEEKQTRLEQYKNLRQSLNQSVHPFNEKDEWSDSTGLQIKLNQGYTQMRRLAVAAGLELSLPTAQKIVSQIPDIAEAVAYWINWLKQQLEVLDLKEDEKKWMEQDLLPYVYWQVHQTKTTRRKKDEKLNQYYKQRLHKAKDRFEQNPLTSQMEVAQKEKLVHWAFRKVTTFHRASSRVEGRNGYLAFIHHAKKGMTQNRKKTLTIIHNFDIQGADRQTPAQRLFNKEFPDLFEFLMENIGPLPKPRKKKILKD